MSQPLLTRTQIKGLAAILCLALGAGLSWWSKTIESTAPATNTSITSSPERTNDVRSASRTGAPSPGTPNAPADRRVAADPAEVLRNAPKDPIVPPVIHVEAELAPRGRMTSEPLVPPVIYVDAEPALRDGPAPTSAPLTPPVISADAPTSPRR